MRNTSAINFEISGTKIEPDSTVDLQLPISNLSNKLTMSLPVKIIHGKKRGPVLFVSAAVHGDEIIGIEIIRRLIKRPAISEIAGTLMLIPVVNGYGFLNHSRYLPDRRDLNRSFPGSTKGSLAARLAGVFVSEILERADYGIDLHSAAIHRENLPQIRVAPESPRGFELAKAFGAPVIVRSPFRPGSLRQAAHDCEVPLLLFEGGEGLRFDETAIRAGLAGVLRVMKTIGMVDAEDVTAPQAASFVSTSSQWLRASNGGILRMSKVLGDSVTAGSVIGTVSDLFGDVETDIVSPIDGVVLGRATLPIVNEGDAVCHIARAEKLGTATDKVENIVDHLEQASMFYEDEII